MSLEIFCFKYFILFTVYLLAILRPSSTFPLETASPTFNLLTDVGPRDMFSDRASVIIESYLAESALGVQLWYPIW